VVIERERRGRGTAGDKEMKAEREKARAVGWMLDEFEIRDEIGVQRADLTTEHEMQSRVLPNTRLSFTGRQIGVDSRCCLLLRS